MDILSLIGQDPHTEGTSSPAIVEIDSDSPTPILGDRVHSVDLDGDLPARLMTRFLLRDLQTSIKDDRPYSQYPATLSEESKV
jgi:hypothetical protein